MVMILGGYQFTQTPANMYDVSLLKMCVLLFIVKFIAWAHAIWLLVSYHKNNFPFKKKKFLWLTILDCRVQ